MCSNGGIGERDGGAVLKPFLRCKAALYYGRECQVQHWKAGAIRRYEKRGGSVLYGFSWNISPKLQVHCKGARGACAAQPAPARERAPATYIRMQHFGLLRVQLLGFIGARASCFPLLPPPPWWLMTGEAPDHVGRGSSYASVAGFIAAARRPRCC